MPVLLKGKGVGRFILQTQVSSRTEGRTACFEAVDHEVVPAAKPPASDHLNWLCFDCAPWKAIAAGGGLPGAASPTGEGNSSSSPSSSDLRAAHVFPLPRVYLCSALDRILRTECGSYKCPKSE